MLDDDLDDDLDDAPRDLTIDELDHAPNNTGDLRLPDDPTLEAAALGAALLDAGQQGIAQQTLTNAPPADYHTPTHQLIATTIADLLHHGEPCDTNTVRHHLEQAGHLHRIGGPARLAELTRAPAAITSGPTYATRIAALAQRRRLITAAHQTATAATRGDQTLLTQALADLHTHTTPPAQQAAWDNVADIMRGTDEPVRPTILTRTDSQALIYPGRLHWLMGEPGKGKTWVAIHATAQQLQQDQTVVYLDHEGSRSLVADRLDALDIDPDTVDRRLHYKRAPEPAHLAAAAQLAPALVVIDGVAAALSANGLNENDAHDVLTWLDTTVWPLTATGAAVLVLDHVTKDRDTGGLWPRGSGAKQGAVDGAAWMLKTRQPFSRTKAGHADLIQAKDREGFVGTDGQTIASMYVSPGVAGGLTIDLRPPTSSPTNPDGTFRPTVLMERVSRWLEINPDASHRSIREHVKGKNAALDLAVEALIADGHIVTHPDGRQVAHRVDRPYRETTDPHLQPTQAAPSDDLDESW